MKRNSMRNNGQILIGSKTYALHYLSRKPVNAIPSKDHSTEYKQKIQNELSTLTNDIKLISEGKRPSITTLSQKRSRHSLNATQIVLRRIKNYAQHQNDKSKTRAISIAECTPQKRRYTTFDGYSNSKIEIDLSPSGFTVCNMLNKFKSRRRRCTLTSKISPIIEKNMEHNITLIDAIRTKDVLHSNCTTVKKNQKKQRISILREIQKTAIKAKNAKFGQSKEQKLKPIEYTRKSIEMIVDANSSRYFDSYKEFLHEYHNTVIAGLLAPSDKLKFRINLIK